MFNTRGVQLVSGWGRNLYSRPARIIGDFTKTFDLDLSRGMLPTGNHRSYGDSSLTTNGISLSSVNLKEIKVNAGKYYVTCGSGVTIGELSRISVPEKLYPFVVPGTEFVTIGGAIASDIHGKSHHKVGSFSEHVLRIRIKLSTGELLDLFPEGPTSEWFNATCGGLGLTGFIVEADIQLQRIEEDFVLVENRKFYSLQELKKLVLGLDSQYLYSVAWIDLSGSYSGRGILSLANHSLSTNSERWGKRLSFGSPARLSIPFKKTPCVINPFTVRLFNEVWFRKKSSISKQKLRSFMHPLDGISNWNKLYGNFGFIQYQFVVPESEFLFLEEVLELLKIHQIASPLGVLKRLGGQSKSLLGFADKGWTLAIDIPRRTRNLDSVIEELDAAVINRGGKVYLTKDSCLTKEGVRLMYPQLKDWQKIKSAMDPVGLWVSDQSRRLGL